MTDHLRLFGWIPPEERTTEQQDAHEEVLATMPAFSLGGMYRDEKGRYALWDFVKRLRGGKHIGYIHQTTGSCVGAGGANMLRTLAHVEIAQGQPEMWPVSELWWPWTYGQSRRLLGIRGRGEGSLGSGWARAIKELGCFSRDQVTGLPEFQDDGEGWLQLPKSVELEWSDGGSKFKEPYKSEAIKHPVQTVSPVRSSDEVKAAHQNGYCITLASRFGVQNFRRAGSPEVNLAYWDDTWNHQMFSDETWDHPTLGRIHRIGNNWPPSMSPPPTGEEPKGGFYVTASTMDDICRARGSEVYAYSSFDGFPVRDIWFI